MRAVGFQKSLPIHHPQSLLDIELPEPRPSGRDLLVRVQAVSVNPIDTKMRMRSNPQQGAFAVLGWDAVGVVEEAGGSCELFRPGDRVFYAGDLMRPGTNAELHLVDERITGPAPRSISSVQAVALPLTSLTAWEVLFDRLDVRKPVPGATPAMVIIGGAGGVGSIAVQIAKTVSGLTVVASASRPESKDWVRSLGADHVIDHSRPINEEIGSLGIGSPGFFFSTMHTDRHFEAIVDAIAPQGRMALIDDPEPIDVRRLKRKSVSLHWELMFTRSLFGTPDLIRQHHILRDVSTLVDEGKLRSTMVHHFGRIEAVNLRRAHAMLERGETHGKIVLEGF